MEEQQIDDGSNFAEHVMNLLNEFRIDSEDESND
jgi:hypothetical protein